MLKTVLFDPATGMMDVGWIPTPLGSRRVAWTGTADDRSIGWLNVTRAVSSVPAATPLTDAFRMVRELAEGVEPPVHPTAAAASSTPPVSVLPCKDDTGWTVDRTRLITC